MAALQAAAVLAALLTPATAALVGILPAETATLTFPLGQVHPFPTEAPSLPAEFLAARQNDDNATSTTETVLAGPDSICGYVDGRPGASFFCPRDNRCFFFTSKATMTGAVACCNTDQCNLRLRCLDYVDVVTSSLCDNGCMADAFTLKCTEQSLPYCNTASFSSGIFDYWCAAASISTPQSLTTAYTGQSADRSFTPLVLTDPTTTGESDVTRARGSATSSPTGVVDEEGDDPDDEGADGGADGGGGSGRRRRSNGGAIAGGVVGGVAIIALAGISVLLINRRKKAQQNAAPTNPPAFAPSPQQGQQQQQQLPVSQYGNGAPPPAGWVQSVYEPNYAQGMHPTSPGAVSNPEAQAQAYYNQPQGQQQYQQSQGGLSPISPVRNSSTSPVDSALVSSTAASQVGYGYQTQQPQSQQFQAVAPQVQPQGQPQGQPYGQPQGQAGGDTRPLPELGS
ncbi:uncharacterized protein DNG_08414 [Cephalotrichum gorgonifer]|uniref:Uncharacterized protein n=1 Tax=Cephalotrichum gorgonifer TaxID=2041049 RepID=A0AAE8N6F1_9PEZI|nr:uncharacterized protein DNG_08414 [Cephalotrichum gorgonifer]